MNLGLSVACYRWVCYPPATGAGVSVVNVAHPDFLLYGRPRPYASSVQGPEPGKHIEWSVERASDLGLSPLYLSADWLRDEAHARWLRGYAEEREVKLVTGGEGSFADCGPAWVRARESFVNQMTLSRAAGAQIIVAVQGGGAFEHGHFSKNPPIDEQLERMISNFRELVDHAERLGIVMALENHLDYRCSELAVVLAAVNSPWLRMNFDFANSLSVIEDPVDAARAVARWTVMTHIKDMRIQPKTLDGEPKIMGCPVGDGNVDIAAVMRVLETEAPDPRLLQHCLELCVLPDQDPDLWVRRSMQWLAINHGSVFA